MAVSTVASPAVGGSIAGVYGNFMPGANHLVHIQTVTVGAGGASSIEFTNIPQGYKHLQVRGVVRSTRVTVASAFGVRLGNGPIDTGSNYTYHGLVGDGATASAFAGTAQTTSTSTYAPGANQLASTFAAFVIDVLDYADTGKNTTVRASGGADLNGSGQYRLSSGLWLSTAAVTVLALIDQNAANFAQHSTASLYGVVGAGWN